MSLFYLQGRVRGALTELLPLYPTALGCREDPACPHHATSHMITLGESQRVAVVLPETLEGMQKVAVRKCPPYLQLLHGCQGMKVLTPDVHMEMLHEGE